MEWQWATFAVFPTGWEITCGGGWCRVRPVCMQPLAQLRGGEFNHVVYCTFNLWMSPEPLTWRQSLCATIYRGFLNASRTGNRWTLLRERCKFDKSETRHGKVRFTWVQTDFNLPAESQYQTKPPKLSLCMRNYGMFTTAVILNGSREHISGKGKGVWGEEAFKQSSHPFSQAETLSRLILYLPPHLSVSPYNVSLREYTWQSYTEQWQKKEKVRKNKKLKVKKRRRRDFVKMS